MKRPHFTLRDLFWLVLVAAMAVAWWIDRDRIHRQRESLKVAEQQFADERAKFRGGTQRLTELQLKLAEARLNVAEAELASMVEINRNNPRAVSEHELSRYEGQVNMARLDLEKAYTTMDLLGDVKNSARAMVPPPLNAGSPKRQISN